MAARIASLTALVVCLASLSCASALRDPATLTELPSATSMDVAALSERAAASFAERTPESVRAAAATWLELAAAEPGDVRGLVGAARAQAWLADHAPDAEARRAAARAAVEAGQRCELRQPESAECAYWLAIALGVQARERHSTALDGLDVMIDRLQRAIEGDPRLDHAGPHRVLALVYLRAPGWPSGPGDPDHGLEEARRAVALDPDYPPNQICLGEALAATDDPAGSRRALEKAADLAAAPAEAGSADAREWLDQIDRMLAGMPEKR